MSFLDEALRDYNTTRQVDAPPQFDEPQIVGTFTDVQTQTINGETVGTMLSKNAIASDPDDAITVPATVVAAPVAYDQTYTDTLRAAVNTLTVAVTALTAEVHDLKAKARTAGHLAT